MALVSADRLVQCDELYIQDQRYVKDNILPLNVYTLYKHRLDNMGITCEGAITDTINGVSIRAVNTQSHVKEGEEATMWVKCG